MDEISKHNATMKTQINKTNKAHFFRSGRIRVSAQTAEKHEPCRKKRNSMVNHLFGLTEIARTRRFGSRCVLLTLCALIASVNLSLPAATEGTYTVFDVPGAINTVPEGISGGVIAGQYETNGAIIHHGFVRAADGTFSTFDVPGAFLSGTLPYSISNSAVTGNWQDSNLVFHGFVRSADGVITSFDPPESLDTEPASINSKGVIAGSYIFRNGATNGRDGFVRAVDGTFTTFAPEGAAATFPFSINNKGQVAGYFLTGDGRSSQAFVRAADGTITTYAIDYATLAFSINDKGEIAGTYYDINGVHTDYVRAPDGTITTFVPEGNIGRTYALRINNEGAIAGYYTDANGYQGFVRKANGKIEEFHVPDSVQAIPYGIDSGDDTGTITGTWADSNGNYHGFLRAPTPTPTPTPTVTPTPTSTPTPTATPTPTPTSTPRPMPTPRSRPAPPARPTPPR
jgi:hypothetical protein